MVQKIAIVGLPNTGKSQVFNNLTKQYTLVSNYPLTTISIRTVECQIGKKNFEVMDTPGMHCLYIHSEEELLVRDMLIEQKPDIIVQCIDANRLKQSLTLTADLLELGVPMVISLNAVDETGRRGIWINSGELSHQLGVPVIESVAIKGLGTDDLKNAILSASREFHKFVPPYFKQSLHKSENQKGQRFMKLSTRVGKQDIHYGDIVEQGIVDLSAKLPDDIPYKRKMAVLLLLEDPFLLGHFKKVCGTGVGTQLEKGIKDVQQQFGSPISRLINNKRNQWIIKIIEKSAQKQKLLMSGFSQTFAQLSRHPVFGIPILMGVLAIMYLLVVNVANEMAGWIDATLWTPISNQIDRLVPAPFWNEFLIGDYGVLSLGLANAFITVLPILSVFFLVFSALEDSGYLPNLCVLVKRISEKLGLSGNAIMPLVLGFGCKTMATLTTGSLRSKKEQYIAIYLIAFAIPCAPQLGLNMSILGRLGASAFIITVFCLILFEVVVGMILNKVLRDDSSDSFIQELPPIRIPSPKAVIIKTYHRLYWFLEEAVPIFIYAALALFLIEKIGILDALKNLMSPLMEGWLGLPLEMVDALLLTMARHEAAAGLIMKLIEAGKLNYIQCIVAVTITTMFVPCFANIVSMIKQLGAKKAITMALIINMSAFLLGGILNRILLMFIKL